MDYCCRKICRSRMPNAVIFTCAITLSLAVLGTGANAHSTPHSHIRKSPPHIAPVDFLCISCGSSLQSSTLEQITNMSNQRSGKLIRFLEATVYNFLRGLTAQECIAEFDSVLGDEAPPRQTVMEWYLQINANSHEERKENDDDEDEATTNVHRQPRNFDAPIDMPVCQNQELLSDGAPQVKLEVDSDYYGDYEIAMPAPNAPSVVRCAPADDRVDGLHLPVRRRKADDDNIRAGVTEEQLADNRRWFNEPCNDSGLVAINQTATARRSLATTPAPAAVLRALLRRNPLPCNARYRCRPCVLRLLPYIRARSPPANITALAAAVRLAPSTICKYMDQLLRAGHPIWRSDLKRLFGITSSLYKRIVRVLPIGKVLFRLSPIMERLPGDVEWSQLRLVASHWAVREHLRLLGVRFVDPDPWYMRQQDDDGKSEQSMEQCIRDEIRHLSDVYFKTV